MNTTKTCPHCKKEVDKKATKCPHCQSDLRSWFRQHPIGTLLIVVIFAPIMMSQITDPGSTSSSVDPIHEVKFQNARVLAKSYIERVPLKSPSTAKYKYPTTKVDPKNPNLFEVSSYIDSQNGFGAMIRTYWSMKLEYVGNVDAQAEIDTEANWKIREFIFDGEKIK